MFPPLHSKEQVEIPVSGPFTPKQTPCSALKPIHKNREEEINLLLILLNVIRFLMLCCKTSSLKFHILYPV
jgi:hypothetical protein